MAREREKGQKSYAMFVVHLAGEGLAAVGLQAAQMKDLRRCIIPVAVSLRQRVIA